MPTLFTCACGLTLQPDWKFCPGCGLPPSRNCQRCDRPLEPNWKLCPYCGEAALSAGTSAPLTGTRARGESTGPDLVPIAPVPIPPVTTPPPSGGPIWEPRDLCWSLHNGLFRVFVKPLVPLFTAIQKADSLPALLTARDPGLFVNACATGLTNMVNQRVFSVWPAPVRTGLTQLDGHRKELLALLDPAVSHIRETARAVADLKLPEGFWEQLTHGAAQAATPTSSAGMGALGGAALGSILLPGLGTAIGGALGAMFGSNSTSKRNLAILEQYDQACAQLIPALQAVWNGAWDAVAEVSHKGGCPLPAHPHHDEAEVAWNQVRERIAGAQAGYAELCEYLDEWGPVPEGVRLLFIGCLHDGWGNGIAEARELAEQQRRLFSTRPETLESLCELALADGHAAEARKYADQGLRLEPDSRELLLLQIESLGMLGRTQEAEYAVVKAGEQPGSLTPWISYVRGAARSGDVARTIEAVKGWVATHPVLAHVSRFLKTDRHTAPMVPTLFARVPGLQAFQGDGFEEMAAIVESLLPAVGERAHHRVLPIVKIDHFNRAFRPLDAGEKLLYFYDWSFWADGSIGLVLTTRRVLWRCLWAAAISIPLRELNPVDVQAIGSVLRVGSQQVDVENADLAMRLDATLTELILALHR